MRTYKHRLRIVWVPMLMLAFSFTATSLLLPELPLREGNYPLRLIIPTFPKQPDDAFFVSNGSEELSHIALYHGIGPSIENARKADILLVGNSRTQLGLREQVIHEEAKKLGLKVFTLAVGHADKLSFALEIIRKHDLKPRILIANGSPNVFKKGFSSWAKKVLAMSYWEAQKLFWERSAAWQVKSLLHHYLPHLDFIRKRGFYRWIHYRSEETGWWKNAVEAKGNYPIRTVSESKNYRSTLPLARELKNEMDGRNTFLVTTIVPFGRTQSGHLPYLSKKLDIPYVLPSFDNMQTADGSHLNQVSALTYSKRFWESFIQLKAVRKKLLLE